MARRPKERLRTIQLDADVSEIAQRLADKKELSSTLSELLRVNYGFGDKLEEKKRELHVLLDHKQELIEQENKLYDEIEQMEKSFIDRETNVKPVLQDKLVKLDARIKHLKTQAERTIDASVRRMKYRAIEELEKQMQDIRSQLIEFDSEGVL
jgi:DNA repair exonuclease SbcCD ATPase subunit